MLFGFVCSTYWAMVLMWDTWVRFWPAMSHNPFFLYFQSFHVPSVFNAFFFWGTTVLHKSHLALDASHIELWCSCGKFWFESGLQRLIILFFLYFLYFPSLHVLNAFFSGELQCCIKAVWLWMLQTLSCGAHVGNLSSDLACNVS